jgi:uncharacterized protein YfbU (UPF0304 family)
MANRIINFDDEANTITIVLGGKEWEIKRTVMAVRDKYNLFIEKTMRFQQKVMDMVTDEGANVEQVLEEFTSWKANYIEGIVKQILETNGLEFDGGWWAENVSYNDIVRFIAEVATKDDDKKKAVKAAD